MTKILPGVLMLLLWLIATTLHADTNKQSWEYKSWNVDIHDDFVKNNSHGETVHGHEFGLIKKAGDCNQDLLWISWSTSKKGLDAFKGQEATIRFRIDDAKFQVDMPLLSIFEPWPGLTVVSFSNFIIGDEFKSLLKKGQKVEITIFAPDELARKFDIPTDTFSLNGFTATMLKADEFCEALMMGNDTTVAHKQSNSGVQHSGGTGEKSDQFKSQKRRSLENSRAFFAAKHLESLLSTQGEIFELEPEYQGLAIILAGGALNTKFIEWGREEISKGNITREQLFYIMSLSMAKLSLLTQAADMNEATACHIREAQRLLSMAKGNNESPVNCRQTAYGNELQVRATRINHGPKAQRAFELAKKWVSAVILFSQYSAELDKYGDS